MNVDAVLNFCFVAKFEGGNLLHHSNMKTADNMCKVASFLSSLDFNWQGNKILHVITTCVRTCINIGKLKQTFLKRRINVFLSPETEQLVPSAELPHYSCF